LEPPQEPSGLAGPVGVELLDDVVDEVLVDVEEAGLLDDEVVDDDLVEVEEVDVLDDVDVVDEVVLFVEDTVLEDVLVEELLDVLVDVEDVFVDDEELLQRPKAD